MPHVVTQPCCSDASCVWACPVNCIHPTPDSPEFALAEMLHIDPAACVDCGACVAACPVGAIKPHAALEPHELPFARINARFFSPARPAGARPPRPLLAPVLAPLQVRSHRRPLRVAIVGSGPAGMYAADELLRIPGARVDVFERLPRPYGLARFGVAPDHRRTRRVTRQLDQIAAHPRLTLHTDAPVGTTITHDRLLGDHDAVIYAVGAATDRRLRIPGAQLAHVSSATEFVGWYNGHPDHAERSFDLSARAAVVIGNGNVALDMARMLALDPAALDRSDTDPRALQALRASRIEEVHVVARRGPEHSAFTVPELVGLTGAPGVAVTVNTSDLDRMPRDDPKLDVLRELAVPASGAGRPIHLRYGLSPARIDGGGVEFDGGERIEAGLVLTSIGLRAEPVAGLPFDPVAATVPSRKGRVIDPDTGAPVPRTYVAGWIKRGPTGFIGTNRSCALETVRALVADFNAGELSAPAPLQGLDLAA